MSKFPFRLWELIWYIFIFIIGTIGNCSVIIVIAQSKKIDRGALLNILILTLAIVDLSISMFGLPFYILQTDLFHPSPKYGNLVCFFVNFLQFWLLDVVVYLLTAICLDRRKAIVNPLTILYTRSNWEIALIILSCFFFAACCQTPTIFYGAIYTISSQTPVGNYCGYNYTNVESTIIYVLVLACEIVVPIVIMLFCFRQIWVKLKETDDTIKSVMTTYENHKDYNQKKNVILERKTNSIAVWKFVVLFFFVCIIPNNILYCVFHFAKVHTLTWNSIWYQIGILLRFTNSCLNPFIYNFLSKEFRQHSLEVLRRCRRRKERYSFGSPAFMTGIETYNRLKVDIN